ncbi:MAG: hypothetical protein H0X66_01045 [Verrucomicrobia bacterium]|nr:hypothetical protein [Verrucomicrobiota bacterium]
MGRKILAIGLGVWLLSIAAVGEIAHVHLVALSGLSGLYPGEQNIRAASFSPALFYGWMVIILLSLVASFIYAVWRNSSVSARIFILLFFVSTWAYLLRFHLAYA